MQNAFIHPNHINTLHTSTFLTQPYEDGITNIHIALTDESHSLGRRFTHLLVGVSFLVPIVNIVVYLAVRSFCTHARPVPLGPAGPSCLRGAGGGRKGVQFKEVRCREFNKHEAPIRVEEQTSFVQTLTSASRSWFGFW